MGVLGSQLSAECSSISQLSAKFLAISQLTVQRHVNKSQLSVKKHVVSQLTVKILVESQLSVNPTSIPSEMVDNVIMSCYIAWISRMWARDRQPPRPALGNVNSSKFNYCSNSPLPEPKSRSNAP